MYLYVGFLCVYVCIASEKKIFGPGEGSQKEKVGG